MIHAKHSPLSLPQTPAFRALWASQALLGFMGTLFLLFALALGARANIWLASMQNHVIFEMPINTHEANIDLGFSKTELKKLEISIKSIEGLTNVNALSQDTIAKRLDNWINNVKDLPLPLMVEAEADDTFKASDTLKALQEDYPTLTIHEGREAMKDGLSHVLALKTMAYVLVLVTIMVGATMSLTAAYWRLDVQKDVIDLLHSMGANRRYLITDLARSNFLQTLASAGTGFILAILLLAIIWLFSGDARPQDIEVLSKSHTLWALVIPLLLAIMAAIATGVAVKMRYTAFIKRGE